jgi:hypothetical protein
MKIINLYQKIIKISSIIRYKKISKKMIKNFQGSKICYCYLLTNQMSKSYNGMEYLLKIIYFSKIKLHIWMSWNKNITKC